MVILPTLRLSHLLVWRLRSFILMSSTPLLRSTLVVSFEHVNLLISSWTRTNSWWTLSEPLCDISCYDLCSMLMLYLHLLRIYYESKKVTSCWIVYANIVHFLPLINRTRNYWQEFLSTIFLAYSHCLTPTLSSHVDMIRICIWVQAWHILITIAHEHDTYSHTHTTQHSKHLCNLRKHYRFDKIQSYLCQYHSIVELASLHIKASYHNECWIFTFCSCEL